MKLSDGIFGTHSPGVRHSAKLLIPWRGMKEFIKLGRKQI
jgi:hypothetical protein